MLVELFQAIFVHLNATNILFLFNVDMGNIQPNITKVCRCFANLCEYITSFNETTFMSKYCTNAICRPYIFWIVTKNLNSFLLQISIGIVGCVCLIPVYKSKVPSPDVSFLYPCPYYSDAMFVARNYPRQSANMHRLTWKDFSKLSQSFFVPK